MSVNLDDLTEDVLKRLAQALHAAFQPNRDEVVEALRAIVMFHPQDVPLQFTDPRVNPHYGPSDFKRKGVKEELQEDARAPFISESYLYNLLGKEDARTLLARFRRLWRALGVDEDTLYQDE